MHTLEKWTVLPHGKLSQIDQNILSVVGQFHVPLGEAPRRMTVVRLRDRKLVVYSAIALHESEMKQLETFGKLAYLIVPSGTHRIDAKIWKDRYPKMRVIAPAGAREKVAEVVHVDATEVNFGDPNVHLDLVPGTNAREFALTVKNADGTSVVVNDLIFGDNGVPRGIRGILGRLMGVMGTKPRIPRVIALALIKNKAAVRAQFEKWAKLPNLARVIVSHGDVIEHDPASTLRSLAASLA